MYDKSRLVHWKHFNKQESLRRVAEIMAVPFKIG